MGGWAPHCESFHHYHEVRGMERFPYGLGLDKKSAPSSNLSRPFICGLQGLNGFSGIIFRFFFNPRVSGATLDD